MKEFLAIQEVAEWLGVSEKTVSRLVLSGQLPATRVGGSYRLRQGDIQDYLDRQQVLLQSRTRPADNPALNISLDNIPGVTPGASSCARCGRLFKGPSAHGGECQEPVCGLPLCRLCWANGYDRYCRSHRRSTEQKLAAARERLARGELAAVVSAEDARKQEFVFIQRFDQKIRETRHITGPLDGVRYPVTSWDAIHSQTEELNETRLNRLRLTRPECDASALPLNLTSCYSLPRPARPGGRRGATFSICAAAVSDLEEMAANGFSASFATRSFLLKALEERAAANKMTDSFTVLGLASPTGWSAEAIAMVEGGKGAPGFSSLYVAACLVDLASGCLFHNPLDARLRPFIPLYRGELNYEAVDRIAGWVRQRLAQDRDIMTMKQIGEELGAEDSLVKEACLALAKEGGFDIDQLPEYGLTICKK